MATGVVFAVIMTGLLAWSFSLAPKPAARNANLTNSTRACTQEVKLCPDGSAVGRTEPDCAFAVCPTVQANSNTTSSNPAGLINVNNQVNTNTAPPNTVYSVAEVTTDPTYYQGRELCLTGAYQNSFEFNAFGSGFKPDTAGQNQLLAPYIWVNQSADNARLTCAGAAGERSEICTGTVNICGTFRYALPGQAGFGQLQAYRYLLE